MKIDVAKVAKLASLSIKKEDVEKFESQLSSILDYVKKLNEINTENVEPNSQVTGIENITRDDNPKPCLSQEEALSNTKSKHNGLFRIKAILEE